MKTVDEDSDKTNKKGRPFHPNPLYYGYLALFASFALSLFAWRLYYLYKSNLPMIAPSLSSYTADLEACVDEKWCSIKPPKKSYFRFRSQLVDPVRWRIAQNQAARGDQVLLQRILTYFPNYLDFIDGDIYFRTTHMLADYFFDASHNFDFLKSNSSGVPEKYAGGLGLPPVYHAEKYQRAPIVQVGYQIFDNSDRSPYFLGKKSKELIIGRGKVFQDFFLKETEIHHPFVLINIFNENWGLLSTLVPNRTTDWGRCCFPKEYERMDRLLDHPKLLMLLINQHSNYTHRKLLTVPRGLPIHEDNGRQLIWDSMRVMSKEKKDELFFTASSNWKFRPMIKECISKKFGPEEKVSFVGYQDNLEGRITPQEYYKRLASARLSIALPGLGYDTYRLWESLTFGVVPVIERGVGLDKTVSSF
jgi:hypothetical protein